MKVDFVPELGDYIYWLEPLDPPRLLVLTEFREHEIVAVGGDGEYRLEPRGLLDGRLLPAEPPSIRAARRALRRWEQERVCPELTETRLACTWHCRTCNQSVPPTVGSVSTGNYGVSLVGPYGVRCQWKRPSGAAVPPPVVPPGEGDPEGDGGPDAPARRLPR